jgi:hypothetical protein
MTEEDSISSNKRFCECGCGELIPKRDKWRNKLRYKYGHHMRGKHHSLETKLKISKLRSGANHRSWKGGRHIDREGYIKVYQPGHPRARRPRHQYVYEHILVMEKHVGRYITREESIHHKNGIKSDNRIENLQLMTPSEHTRYHHTGKKLVDMKTYLSISRSKESNSLT